MSATRIALFQMTTGIDPAENAAAIAQAARDAKAGGAAMLFTPEMSGLLDRDRRRATPHIVAEDMNLVLRIVRDTAQVEGLWIALGSLAILRDDGRWANRSFLVAPDGGIVARYDKIHMFDVELATGETWRESAAYAPGERVVTAETPLGRLGLSICYDLRFPALFGALGDRHCDAIAVPAAFTVPTGAAHWHLLLRARAVEESAWIIAAAQVGEHTDGRKTYGHSLVVDPWGEVVLDMGGTGSGVGFADISAERTAEIRAQLPALANRRKMAN